MSNNFYDTSPPYNTMTITGQGHVTTIPNIAIIRLGVQSVGDNLASIQSENAQISQTIIQSLNDMGVTNIKTFQYVIDKNYEYIEGTRVDKGYVVRNIFEIRLDNMKQVGMVIDTAVNSGANVVDFISFEVSDSEVYYQQALNLAVMNALTKATSISKNFGLSMDPVPLRIVENSTAPVPTSQMFSVREGGFTTPVEPGQKRIDAFVTVEFMY